MSAADTGIQEDVEQAGKAEHEVRFAGAVTDIDHRVIPCAALHRAYQHVNSLRDIAKQGLCEQADAV